MMILPYRTEYRVRRFPSVTSLLILINVVAFLIELKLSLQGGLYFALVDWAVIPAAVTTAFSGEMLLDFLRTMFLHGSMAHLVGNMTYLYLFGRHIEDLYGEALYLAFYLLCGTVATLAHIVLAPNSAIPLIGASGAIAGLLGAYVVRFATTRIRALLWIIVYFKVIRLRAQDMLIGWFVIQAVQGFLSMEGASSGGGVAYAAHVGGFLIGFGLTWALAGAD